MEQSNSGNKCKKYVYFGCINFVHFGIEFSFISIVGCGIFNVFNPIMEQSQNPVPSYVFVFQALFAGIIQLFVGAWSDRCTYKYGKRRIFMISGCLIFSISQLISCILMMIVVSLRHKSEESSIE